MKLTVVLVVLLLSMPLSASERVTAVPTQFIGKWGSNRANCGKPADDLALRIQDGRISYIDSSGPLKAIVTNGRFDLALIIELSGEGQTWLAIEQFSLSKDGTTLTDQLPPKTVRYRCKARAVRAA